MFSKQSHTTFSTVLSSESSQFGKSENVIKLEIYTIVRPACDQFTLKKCGKGLKSNDQN